MTGMFPAGPFGGSAYRSGLALGGPKPSESDETADETNFPKVRPPAGRKQQMAETPFGAYPRHKTHLGLTKHGPAMRPNNQPKPNLTMSISLPTETVETETTETTETETENDPKALFEGHVEDYMDYWQSVSMVRYLTKACQTMGVAKVKDEERSPWAAHYVHFRDIKNELRAEMKEAPGSLPKFKDAFGEPDFDFTKVTAENAADFGLDADLFGEDEDPIFVMDEYEAPEVVFYENAEAGEPVGAENLKKTLMAVDRVGEKTADDLMTALASKGYVVTHAE